MRKALQGLFFTALVAFIGIQFVPVDRSNPPARVEIVAPADVRSLLERSCYDCHSNRTRWPWYSRVAPFSWYLARHVGRGRADLNLTEWPLFDAERQRYFLSEMKGQVKNREMPLDSYLWLHRSARLSDEERESLILWLDEEVRLLSGF